MLGKEGGDKIPQDDNDLITGKKYDNSDINTTTASPADAGDWRRHTAGS